MTKGVWQDIAGFLALLLLGGLLGSCNPPVDHDEVEIARLTSFLAERMLVEVAPTPVPSLADPVTTTSATDVMNQARALAERYHYDIKDRYIVVLDEHEMMTSGIDDVSVIASRHGLLTEHVYEHALKGFTANLDSQQIARLVDDPRVEFIQHDNLLFSNDRPVPRGVDRIDADLHRVASIDGVSGTIDVTVAILDTGIDLDHPDLNVVGGIDFVTTDDDNGGDDERGHGTHCAGIAGALDNGVDFGVGTDPRSIMGVAPGVKLWSVRILDADGSGSTSWALEAINWMVGCVNGTGSDCPAGAEDIRVANMSLGCQCGTTNCTCSDVTGDALKLAIENAMAAGITFAISAGNSDVDVGVETSCGYYPSCFAAPIVTASMTDFDGTRGRISSCPSDCGYSGDTDDERASYSNYGANVDIIAPGTCIESTYHQDACTDCEYAHPQCESPRATLCMISFPDQFACCNSSCGECLDPFTCPEGKTNICTGGGNHYCCLITPYATMSGTSMAAPHVAGAAALVIAEHVRNHGSYPTADDVRNILVSDGDENPCDEYPGASCSGLSNVSGLYMGEHRDSMEVSGYSIDMMLQQATGFADVTAALAHHGGSSLNMGVHDTGPEDHGYAGVEFCLSEAADAHPIDDYLTASLWIRLDTLVDWTGIGISGDDTWLYWWWIRSDGSVMDELERFDSAEVVSTETWHYVELAVDRRDPDPANHVASLMVDGHEDASIALTSWDTTTDAMSCVFLFSGVVDDIYQDIWVDEVYIRGLPGGGF